MSDRIMDHIGEPTPKESEAFPKYYVGFDRYPVHGFKEFIEWYDCAKFSFNEESLFDFLNNSFHLGEGSYDNRNVIFRGRKTKLFNHVVDRVAHYLSSHYGWIITIKETVGDIF